MMNKIVGETVRQSDAKKVRNLKSEQGLLFNHKRCRRTQKVTMSPRGTEGSAKQASQSDSKIG